MQALVVWIPMFSIEALLGGGLCATSADRQAIVETLLNSRPLNLVRPDGTDNNGTLVVSISYSLTMITSVVSTVTVATANSKHRFTTSFLQPLPYLVTP